MGSYLITHSSQNEVKPPEMDFDHFVVEDLSSENFDDNDFGKKR